MSAVQSGRTFSASQKMVHSLLRRRHEEKLQVLRIRVDNNPGCGLTGRLRAVEKLIGNGDLVGAGQAKLRVAARLLVKWFGLRS